MEADSCLSATLIVTQVFRDILSSTFPKLQSTLDQYAEFLEKAGFMQIYLVLTFDVGGKHRECNTPRFVHHSYYIVSTQDRQRNFITSELCASANTMEPEEQMSAYTPRALGVLTSTFGARIPSYRPVTP